MTDELEIQWHEGLHVGKLYRITTGMLFKTVERGEDYLTNATSMTNAVKRFQRSHRMVELGQILLYLGKNLDPVMRPRKKFLTENSEIVTPVYEKEIERFLVEAGVDNKPPPVV